MYIGVGGTPPSADVICGWSLPPSHRLPWEIHFGADGNRKEAEIEGVAEREERERERESSDLTMGDDLKGGWQDLNLKEFEVNSHVS